MVAADDRDAELARHREAIDALDGEILARMNERAAHAKAIGTLKAGSGGAAYRPEREAQVLTRLAAANPGPTRFATSSSSPTTPISGVGAIAPDGDSL